MTNGVLGVSSVNALLLRAGVTNMPCAKQKSRQHHGLSKHKSIVLAASRYVLSLPVLFMLFWIAVETVGLSCYGATGEYEVEGRIAQTMVEANGAKLHTTAAFNLSVRDCGWWIKTIETNEIGAVYQREVGSTNGTEIYDCEVCLQASRFSSQITTNGSSRPGVSPPDALKPPSRILGTIISNSIPVGQLDNGVVGHLWLMFASQCYWPSINKGQLPPVYDWHASIAAHGEARRAKAEWDLLGGPGSLPRIVMYLGEWGQTNALYLARGPILAGETLIPNGFVFEEYQVAPLEENEVIHRMVIRKRVDVVVNTVRPVCSRTSLIPLPDGRTVVIDRRFDSGVPSRPPSYVNPVRGQWPTIDESRKLAEAQRLSDTRVISARPQLAPRRSIVLIYALCVAMVGPPVLFLVWHISKRSKRRNLNGP